MSTAPRSVGQLAHGMASVAAFTVAILVGMGSGTVASADQFNGTWRRTDGVGTVRISGSRCFFTGTRTGEGSVANSPCKPQSSAVRSGDGSLSFGGLSGCRLVDRNTMRCSDGVVLKKQ